jgi:cytochrome c-type biogenesis protein CcmH/NrfG
MRPIARLMGVLLLIVGPCGAGAAEYWTYRYKNIDVTAVGSSSYAVYIAHDVDRLGDVLTQILSFKASARLPTHIYILPSDVVSQLAGTGVGSLYKTSGYDTTVIASPDASGSGDRYWGALFGYVGSILAGDGALRYPFWFRLGVPAVFATTEFERSRLKTGGLSAGYALAFGRGTLIPMRTFLGLHQDDPQMKDVVFHDMYQAESWYLAREILVESFYRAEFGKYLDMVHQGRSESEAFAASFPSSSYEELDKKLLSSERAPSHVYVVPSAIDTSADTAAPQKLSAAEVQARVAHANLVLLHSAEALRLASGALQLEPHNERALCALAQGHLGQDDYAAALADVDQLAAGSQRSGEALAESAEVLAALAAAVDSKRVSLDADSATLEQRAKTDYRSALADNPDDLRSWAGLAAIYGRQKDAQGASALLAEAAPVLERYPRNVNLSYALVDMCARLADADCALKYTASWRENALTDHDRARAAAYESRLRAFLEKRGAGSAAAAALTPPSASPGDNGGPAR